ncbi:c-type cytochrome [Enterobacter cancerogenus]|uniref:c-type cytochrome n=1 Tax=Enterobacter cancerogenus TaxID=69218 RepID=UPI003F4AA5E6
MVKFSALFLALSGALISHASWAATDASVKQGEYLAKAGDCAACHTAAGGQPFAGGLKMSTPIGAIYSTNITPDKTHGIGDYSYEDFSKAVRGGVAKDGSSLYPAMPYPSYAKISDSDMHALYDYFMQGVKPVSQENHKSDIPWPLSMRWPLAFWRWTFADDSTYAPAAGQSAQWQRGAYLVQGLGHCGSCHTPRGIGFQEKAMDQNSKGYLTGGTLEGWHAPDLTASPAAGLGSLSEQDITTFLKTGANKQGAAFGSMTDVIAHSTQYLSDEDLNAIAVYLKSLPAADNTAAPQASDATSQALFKGDVSQPGAQVYVDNCAACHRTDGKGYASTFPALAHNPALLSEDPSSVISVILKGGQRAITQQAPTGFTMPDFAWRLDDQQVADVANFIRNGWGNKAAPVTADQVKKIRATLPPAPQK